MGGYFAGEMPDHSFAQDVYARLKEGADSDLHISAQLGLPEVISWLLSEGMEVDEPNNLGKTALHLAVGYNKWRCVDVLLDRNARVDRCDDRGWTPLHFAAYGCNSLISSILLTVDRHLQVDVDYYKVDRERGWTPLHFAVWRNGVVVASILLEQGMGVNDPGKGGLGRTALFEVWDSPNA